MTGRKRWKRTESQ